MHGVTMKIIAIYFTPVHCALHATASDVNSRLLSSFVTSTDDYLPTFRTDVVPLNVNWSKSVKAI